MKRLCRDLCWLAVVGLWWLTPAGAADNEQPVCDASTACEFQLYIENDSFGPGTDRYYTNGIKFGGGVSAKSFIEHVLKVPAERVLQQITDNRGNTQFGLFLGQNLYTPQTHRRVGGATAGPAVGGMAVCRRRGAKCRGQPAANRGARSRHGGPAALGRLVQTEWHRLVNADKPLGWRNQLRNEPGILLAYFEKLRYGPSSGVQVVPHFGATVGNVMTLVRTGGIVRVGHNMSGFGPDTIEPGGAMLQRTRQHDAPSARAPEWYVFAGVDGRLVARNIFLDGNSFRDSASVDRRVFVHDFKAGFSLRLAPVRLSFTHVQRSAEFSTPLGSSGKQRFQSLNVGWEF